MGTLACTISFEKWPVQKKARGVTLTLKVGLVGVDLEPFYQRKKDRDEEGSKQDESDRCQTGQRVKQVSRVKLFS